MFSRVFLIIASVVAGLPSAAQAAIITLDLRVAGGGGKSAVVTQAGNSVPLELYAVIQNNDGNRANDAFQLAHGALLSVESASGALGNLQPLTLNTPFLDSILSAPGVANNLDARSDLEIGSTDPEVLAGWIQLSTGLSAKFGTGSGSGGTEFLLGTTSWTYSGMGLDSTALNFAARLKTSGTPASKQLFKGQSDGIAFSLDAGVSSDVAFGAPVNINVNAIPEPGTYALGTLLLAGLAGWKLRRKKS